jgi:hypothetical protein
MPATTTSQATIPPNPRSRNVPQLLIQNVLVLGSFTIVALFVMSTPWAQSRSDQGLPLNNFLKLDQSVALAVVTAAQTMLTAALGSAMDDAFDCLLRYMIARQVEVPSGTVLALSSATGIRGTLALLVKPPSMVERAAKVWALLR